MNSLNQTRCSKTNLMLVIILAQMNYRHLALLFLFLSLATYLSAANAQRCDTTCSKIESMLGMTEQTIVAFIPELKRLAKSIHGPGKTSGRWILEDTHFATQPFSATFFFKMGEVRRIEYVSTSPRTECAKRVTFNLVEAELERTYGESLMGGTFQDGATSIESISFSPELMDVSLLFSLSPENCFTRIIYKTREVKDASEL